MNYRKLRIAWSVAWGVVAVLLCVLWVRSYWWHEIFRYNGPTVIAGVSTYSGGLTVYSHADRGFGIWEYLRYPAYKGYGAIYGYERDDNDLRIGVPIAAVLSITSALAAAPWFRYRFSLRTLLIATTLVAVGLGAVMWMTR